MSTKPEAVGVSQVDLCLRNVTPAALWRAELRWAGVASLAEKTGSLSWGDPRASTDFPLKISPVSRALHISLFHTGAGLGSLGKDKGQGFLILSGHMSQRV